MILVVIGGIKAAFDASPALTIVAGIAVLMLLIYVASSGRRVKTARLQQAKNEALRRVISQQCEGHLKVIRDCQRICQESKNPSTRESRARLGLERLSALSASEGVTVQGDVKELRAYFAAVDRTAAVADLSLKATSAARPARRQDLARRALQLAVERSISDEELSIAHALHGTEQRPLSLEILRRDAGDAVQVDPESPSNSKRWRSAIGLMPMIDLEMPRIAREDAKKTGSASRWIPRGSEFEIQGRKIAGGMVYINDRPSESEGLEPSTIVTSLGVDWADPDRDGSTLSYWPDYSRISPAARAGYLNWLSTGRRDPGVKPGFVFVFDYGLEHRVLAEQSDADPAERREILVELDGLLSAYGAHGSVQSYLGSLRDFIAASDLDTAAIATGSRVAGGNSLSLRVALAQSASNGSLLPPELAWQWLRCDDSANRKLARIATTELARQLFEVKYCDQRNPIQLHAASEPIRVVHHPASAAFRGRVFERTLPINDIDPSDPAFDRIRVLLAEVVDELTPLARFLSRSPDERESLRAAALLPDELVRESSLEAMTRLRNEIEVRLQGVEFAEIDGAVLLHHWPTQGIEGFAKRDGVTFCQLLGKLGFGIEPDPRFGGRPLSNEITAIVFAMQGDAIPREPSDGYRTASAIVALCSSAIMADGKADAAEREFVELEIRRLAENFELDSAESMRLRALLRSSLASPTPLSSLRSRFESMGVGKRAAIGRLLVGIATSDGRVDASEMTYLAKAYRILGLDPSTVHRDVNEMSTASETTTEPVVMATGSTRRGVPLPARGEMTSEAQSEVKDRSRALRLDPARIDRKSRESAEACALLATVFAEDAEVEVPRPRVASTSDGPLRLDDRHQAFFRELSVRPTWTRPEFDSLARTHGLMPDGAMEIINDAALEKWGAPFLEDGDSIDVSTDLLDGARS